jgi:hypothetical protein
MKALLLLSMLALIALPAQARVECYSWEDGGTWLGTSAAPPAVDPTNVTGVQNGLCGSCTGGSYQCPGAYDGDRYLHVAEAPHSGTPQVWIAWVTGLNTGDVVTASFYGYDITLDPASPSLRIWGGFTDGVSVANYISSAVPATPVPAYTPGNGWGITQYTYLPLPATAAGLRIEARLYSTPATDALARTDYWLDKLCVTVPDYATVHFPLGVSAVESSTWSTVKSLYR